MHYLLFHSIQFYQVWFKKSHRPFVGDLWQSLNWCALHCHQDFKLGVWTQNVFSLFFFLIMLYIVLCCTSSGMCDLIQVNSISWWNIEENSGPHPCQVYRVTLLPSSRNSLLQRAKELFENRAHLYIFHYKWQTTTTCLPFLNIF